MIKQLDRAAKVSWCPSSRYPTLFASGTIAGTIDDSFESRSQLEIYDLNLCDNSNDVKLVGSVTSKDCFHSIAWGTKGIEDGSYPYGLLAGGMSDGSINIWNSASIVKNYGNALLSRSEFHKGQVLGLQFHPTEPNLLASGATDGEVYIWDLANTAEPKATKPQGQAVSLSSARAPQPAIACLAWNKKVMQILATSSETGETTVWDLRQKRSIISFRNSARIQVRATSLSWNPEASVQLAVCYANHPVAEIWDLRQAMTPRAKLEGGHSGSILGIDWCMHDPSLLLTTGEDGKLVAWNPNNCNYLTEYAMHGTSFDVAWNPNVAGLISTCSYDGKVSFHNIHHTGSHVPAWYKRPAGVSFGFGGKIASFSAPAEKKPTAPNTTPIPASPRKTTPTITVSQLVSDPSLSQLSSELQSVLQAQQFQEYAAQKASLSKNSDEVTTWKFMQILFETDWNTQRALLLKELGVEPPAESAAAQQIAEATVANTQHSHQPISEVSEDDFFNTIAATPAANNTAPEKEIVDTKLPTTDYSAPSGPFTETVDDRAIRQSLLFGDFKAAVDRCLKIGRIADAIVFSSFGPPQLWEETRAAYFSQHKHPFIRNVLRSVVTGELEKMVSESDLSDWKQTLATLISYTTGDKYRTLANQLGSQLQNAGKLTEATVCFMCASNVDKAIELFSRRGGGAMQSTDVQSALIAFHQAVEKITIFANAVQRHGPVASQYLSAKYAEYAGVLTGEGCLLNAWNYLCVVQQLHPAGASDHYSSVLLDRIFHAQVTDPSQLSQAPAFPFHLENVGPSPNLNAILQDYENQKAKIAQMRQNAALRQQPPTQQSPYAPAPATNAVPSYQPNPYAPHPNAAPQSAVPYGASPYAPAPSAVDPRAAAAAAYAQQQQAAALQQQQQAAAAAAAAQAAAAARPGPYGAPPSGPYGAAPSHPHAAPGGAYFPPNAAPSNYSAPQTPRVPDYAHPPAGAPMNAPYGAPPAAGSYGAPAAASAPTPAPAAASSQPPPPRIFNPPSSTAAAAPAGSATAAYAAAAAQAAPAPIQLSDEQKGMMSVLEQLADRVGASLKGPEQRKIQESKTRLSILQQRLGTNELSHAGQGVLSQLCHAVQSNDFTAALSHHLQLVKTEWTNNDEWLIGLKNILTQAKKTFAH